MSEIKKIATREAYGNALVFHLLSREIMHLYLCKYGVDAVCDFKFEDVK